MNKSITILDKDYAHWVKELSSRYRHSQIKAAVRVNEEMLRFYWDLGRDINEMNIEERWGHNVIKNLSADLQRLIPNAEGFSRTNLYYIKKFYSLYHTYVSLVPQVEGQMNPPQDELVPQFGGQILNDLFATPWGHHKLLIDKCYDNPEKALFFVRQTVEHGWSRAMLLNFLDTDLYERQGKAITNFANTLPAPDSDLAQEITKDPYNFDFACLRNPYNERQLKDALIANIEKFLIELGTGFAYMGREFRLEVGKTEQFLDMLFYNVRLHCYVVIEVKTTDFSPAHLGQLGTYVVAVDHILRKEGDNKTIGLLVCKTKDNVFAQYALEASNQPLGISEYELSKLYPAKVEGTIPSIAEIEAKLSETENMNQNGNKEN
jgi:predicted nuclease of restriction endonuclease-like (RecB) superfamily